MLRGVTVGLDEARMLELLRDAPAWLVFALTSLAFAGLYFGAALAGLGLRRLLPGRTIDARPLKPHQVRDEVRRSLVSIAVFGLYGVVTVKLLATGALAFAWQAPWWVVAADFAGLMLWNEVHFYACHRLLHTTWLMKRVHYVHHLSLVPTPFSTYSFHWFEAALLGSVMLCALPLRSFHVVAVLLLPLGSIALNVLGHWNWDPVPGLADGALPASSRRHSAHHARGDGNLGFLLPWFDRALRTRVPR